MIFTLISLVYGCFPKEKRQSLLVPFYKIQIYPFRPRPRGRRQLCDRALKMDAIGFSKMWWFSELRRYVALCSSLVFTLSYRSRLFSCPIFPSHLFRFSFLFYPSIILFLLLRLLFSYYFPLSVPRHSKQYIVDHRVCIYFFALFTLNFFSDNCSEVKRFSFPVKLAQRFCFYLQSQLRVASQNCFGCGRSVQ